MKLKDFLRTLFTGKSTGGSGQSNTAKSDDMIRKDRLKGIQELLEKALFEISATDVDEVMKAGQSAIEKDHRFDITPEDMSGEKVINGYTYAWDIDDITNDDSAWFILKQTDKLFCALYYLAMEPWSREIKGDRYLCIPEDYILPEGTCKMLFFKAVLANRNYSHFNEPHVYLTRVSGGGRQYRFLNLLTNSIWEDTIDTYAGSADDAATYGWRKQKECRRVIEWNEFF